MMTALLLMLCLTASPVPSCTAWPAATALRESPVPPSSAVRAPVVRTRPVPEQQADRWFGEDKQRHLAMAFFATSFGHAAARVAGIEAGTATVLGIAGAAAASLGKEFFDRRAGGPFSFRDLVWDAAGIALGVVLVDATR